MKIESHSKKRCTTVSNSVGAVNAIVIVIIAVVVLLAIIGGMFFTKVFPPYEDYKIRAKVAEAYSVAAVAKIAVSEYAIEKGGLPEDGAAAGIEGLITSDAVSSVKVDKGVIYVDVAPATGTTGTLVFTPSPSDGGVAWSCKQSTVPAEYLPASCK